ncbi:MAG: ribonuclease P protein component [Ignavibacteria bacterium]|nr:ribonuclease P protein component [Ignavibacteria bacterium]
MIEGQGLKKGEILRGYGLFQKILRESRSVSANFLRVHAVFPASRKDSKNSSPPLAPRVRVGFLVAKKKIRKSFLRNRIRRLLKETYRKNKSTLLFENLNMDLLITLTDRGYEQFLHEPMPKQMLFDEDMRYVIRKILDRKNVK